MVGLAGMMETQVCMQNLRGKCLMQCHWKEQEEWDKVSAGHWEVVGF